MSVHLIVESAGVADGRPGVVPAPEAGAAGQAVAAPGVRPDQQFLTVRLQNNKSYQRIESAIVFSLMC